MYIVILYIYFIFFKCNNLMIHDMWSIHKDSRLMERDSGTCCP